MNDKVAIVGCGPSGMVIAHACQQLGVECVIYAPKRPSFISGAQYLHSDIGVRAEGIAPRTIHYVHQGSPGIYEQKIYGQLPRGMQTSWHKFRGDAEAWPFIDIYRWLWERYSHKIVDGQVYNGFLYRAPERYCAVFNTAPLNKLGLGGTFHSETVQIINGVSFADPDMIVYNGRAETPWYRSSNLWGHMSVEYPRLAEVPRALAQYGLRVVTKPLTATGVKVPEGVILSGRYGRWQKGVLVDESYHQAIAEIKQRL